LGKTRSHLRLLLLQQTYFYLYYFDLYGMQKEQQGHVRGICYLAGVT
jgi:hypothetical protein